VEDFVKEKWFGDGFKKRNVGGEHEGEDWN